MDLLGDSDGEGDERGPVEINTDNSYASKYDTWRQKEHIQKLKDKYGEDYEEEDEEDSEESSDDSEAEELDDELEKDFFATLASLKKKDPKIYDGETVFFKEKAKSDGGEKEKVQTEKKLTLKDLETHVMLKKGGHFDEIEDKSLKYGKDMSYNEEMESIKDSFKNALKSNKDGDDDVLEKKVKTSAETQKEEAEYKSWLAGQKSSISDQDIENKMSGLRDFWNKDDLDEGEKFLKDYLLKKRFLDKNNVEDDEDEEEQPAYDTVAHDSDDGLSEDEANVEKMEEFEHKFNFRFEEPDEEFIKRYPRTIKGTMRKEEDKRAKKRKEVEERKKMEKQQKKEEIKMLKNAKKKEIMAKLEKLKKITGNEDMELDDDDIEGDFDPEKYDAKMREVFNNYDDDTQADLEKPTFSDLEDEDYDEDYEAEDWDNWTGADNTEGQGAGDAHCEDEDFNMDCDYDANLAMQKEIVESTKGRKKGRRKSKFAEALENNQSKPAFDPKDEKTFEEYVEEYYKLDCEDIIDDVHCRFRYRNVPVNDFGLSTEEILASEDRELNAWASLRKTCMYRREEEEKKDFHVYKNRAKDERLKKKLLPTLFKEEAEEAAVEVSGDESETAVKKMAGKKKRKLEASEDEVGNDSKKSKSEEVTSDIILSNGNQNNAEESTSKKKKKKSKKKKSGSQGVAIQTNGMASLFTQTAQNSSKKPVASSQKASKNFKHQRNQISKNKKPDDGVGISNERLKAYGVNPNKFKRDKRKERFKNAVKEKE